MLRRLFALIMLGVFAMAAGGVASADEVVPQSRSQIELTFSPLVKQAAPAVVNVYTKTVVKERPTSPFFDDPFFQQFFGSQFGGQPRERIQNSLGSGVIVRPDGLIVTNNHVIADAQEIRVVLSDGRELPAKVISADEKFDLALLKVDTKGKTLPVMQLKDSDEVDVGDLVLAIGDPFGVGQTVTMGIISATARTNIGGEAGYYLQTDAAINPGNSGGALISTDGKLVGINTAIYSKTGGSIGIGFAIPSNMVASFVAAESSGGKLVQPWVGASGETLTADIAASMGFAHPGGIVVKQVYPGGPAARAGVLPGDVVIGINGKDVADPGSLRFRLATLKIGTTAKLNLIRKGQAVDLTVDLIAAPDTPAPQETLLKGEQPLSGAVIANLSPALSDTLGIGDWQGVVIEKVRRGSYADQFDFEPGDILVKINSSTVASVTDVEQVVSGPADTWSITINRDGQTKTIEVH